MSKPIERLLDQKVQWEEIPLEGCSFAGEPGVLYATHSGTLEIGAARFRVYQLNDGRRVFDADDVAALGRFPSPEIPDTTGGKDQ